MSTKEQLKEFVNDRDETLLSLDEERILDYFSRNKIPTPKDKRIFWASIHKSILQLKSATTHQRMRSVKWLNDNGFDL